jgi:hypothetical protein
MHKVRAHYWDCWGTILTWLCIHQNNLARLDEYELSERVHKTYDVYMASGKLDCQYHFPGTYRAAEVRFGPVLRPLEWNREPNVNLRGCSCRTSNRNRQNRFYKVRFEFERVRTSEPRSNLCQNRRALGSRWNIHSDGTGIFYKVIVLNIHGVFYYDSRISTLGSYLNSWRVIRRPGATTQMKKKKKSASTTPHTAKSNAHSLCRLT